MKGDRWVFRRMTEARFSGFPGAQPGVEVPEGDLIAEVAAKAMPTTAQAHRFQQSLANRLGNAIGSYRTSGTENPSLAHHGLSRAASWHVVWGVNGAAIADLYTPARGLARRIAEAISKVLDAEVILLDNVAEPRTMAGHPVDFKTGVAAADYWKRRRRNAGMTYAQAVKKLGADHVAHVVAQGAEHVKFREWGQWQANNRDAMEAYAAVLRHHFPAANPAADPVPGEVWSTLGGGKSRVLAVERNRVQVLHLDSGNREWIGRSDFLSLYRAPRTPARNPSRSMAARERRQDKRLKTLKPRRLYRAQAAGRTKRAGYLLSDFVTRQMARGGKWSGRPNPGDYVPVAAAAKELRAALKRHFPGVKFTVRSKSYAGGASIRVGYTNGPRSADVDRIAQRFAGADFDGMTDLKSYKSALLVGEGGVMREVRYGSDFVFVDRNISQSLMDAVVAQIGARWEPVQWSKMPSYEHQTMAYQGVSKIAIPDGEPEEVTAKRAADAFFQRVPNPKGKAPHKVAAAGERVRVAARGHHYGESGEVLVGGGVALVKLDSGKQTWFDANRLTGTGRRANPYDGLGNGYQVGSVLIGTGLQNAGRAYTVLAIGKTAGRVQLEEHLSGRKFWTFDRHYRVDTRNPRRRNAGRVFGQAVPSQGIASAIRAGDRVTIRDRFGKERTGRAVMPSAHGGWVLNMGGAHGTPGIADESNIVRVSKAKTRNPRSRRPRPDDWCAIDSADSYVWSSPKRYRSAAAALKAATRELEQAQRAGLMTRLAWPIRVMREHERQAQVDARWRAKDASNPRTPTLSVPDRHALKIARDTLKMTDAMARVMGGPTKAEAREIIYRLTGKWPQESNPRKRRRDFGTSAHFDRFSIVMPREAIEDLSGSGAKDEAADLWAGRVARPAAVTADKLAAELREYGAWDADELADDDANWRRILWIAANNIRDEETAGNPGRRRGREPDFHEYTPGRWTEVPAGMYAPPGVKVAAGALRKTLLKRWRSRARKKRNPGVPPAALKTFRKWHAFDPKRVTKIHGPGRVIPRTLVKLGEVPEIIYRSTKWDGKPVTYTHKTRRPYPVLTTDPEGRHLYLVGGRTRVTAAGLVD